MAIRYIIAIGITGVDWVRICCVVHGGPSEVLVIYCHSVKQAGDIRGFLSNASLADKVGIAAPDANITTQSFLAKQTPPIQESGNTGMSSDITSTRQATKMMSTVRVSTENN